ncbi:hypothetical protein NQZ68_019367 [Dissostichus eleginoides]|nr:hypothetical protein NQZ68_019367 [Dissostichus eleginoides]
MILGIGVPDPATGSSFLPPAAAIPQESHLSRAFLQAARPLPKLHDLCLNCDPPPDRYSHCLRICAATTAALYPPTSTLSILGRRSSSAHQRYIMLHRNEILSAQTTMNSGTTR